MFVMYLKALYALIIYRTAEVECALPTTVIKITVGELSNHFRLIQVITFADNTRFVAKFTSMKHVFENKEV